VVIVDPAIVMGYYGKLNMLIVALVSTLAPVIAIIREVV
jgi:hypothetical protein